MSEQIICVQPRVSTAVIFRIIAFFFDILVTPMESTIVITATSPSGIAATARAIAVINESRAISKKALSPNTTFVKISNAKMNTHTPKTSFVSTFESCSSLISRGVLPSSARVMALAILPISVSIPVAVTTALPLP